MRVKNRIGDRINRYMLECKLMQCALRIVLVIELIDTCWNVNKFSDVELTLEYVELIDTCWNVNLDLRPKIFLVDEN